MVKLQIEKFRYVTSEQFRVLTAVEMGMKNHAVVPEQLVAVIASLKNAEIRKLIMELCRLKVIVYERAGKNAGYRLTQAGYDFLALRALTQQNVVTSFGHLIGVGKESEVYVVREGGSERCLKLHRLGTSSFRAVNSKRDYAADRRHSSWLYLARIAAQREFAFLQALHAREFPVPQPFAANRNAVVMQLLYGCIQLNHIRRAEHASSRNSQPDSQADTCLTAYQAEVDDELDESGLTLSRKAAESVLKETLAALTRLAAYGLVHGDFNEFNLMIDPAQLRVWVIDVPQATSRDHPNADAFFERDIRCVERFFRRRFGIVLRRRSRENPDVSAAEENKAANAEALSDQFEVTERNDDEGTQENATSSTDDEPVITLDEITRTDWLDYELRASGYDRALRKKLIEEGRISHQPSEKNHTRHRAQHDEEDEEEDDESAEHSAVNSQADAEEVQEGLDELKLDEDASASQSEGSESESEPDASTEDKSVRNRVGNEMRRAKQRERSRQVKRKWDATASAQRRREMRDTVKQSLGPVWY